MPFTLVSFHAHPDDEALLTAGTLARAAAEGHRVVVVTATAGGAGLVGSALGQEDLADRRMTELRRSAAALGFSEVHLLGYDDSGMDGRAGRDDHAFARLDVETAANRLAEILRSVDADVLTVYDGAGGYGHPDHVQVHRVGVRAAEIAGTAVVLEATIDRRRLLRAVRAVGVLGRLRLAPVGWQPERLAAAYTDPAQLTHRVDVRDYSDQKRAAMAAHVSQATADDEVRSLAVYLRLPGFIFRRVFGYEWYVERGRPPGRPPIEDVFATLRSSGTL